MTNHYCLLFVEHILFCRCGFGTVPPTAELMNRCRQQPDTLALLRPTQTTRHMCRDSANKHFDSDASLCATKAACVAQFTSPPTASLLPVLPLSSYLQPQNLLIFNTERNPSHLSAPASPSLAAVQSSTNLKPPTHTRTTGTSQHNNPWGKKPKTHSPHQLLLLLLTRLTPLCAQLLQLTAGTGTHTSELD